MFWIENVWADDNSVFMPVAASSFAESFDKLYGFLVVISAISSVLVIGGLIYFVVKYRRKTDNDKTAYISHNTTLEFLWSFIPFVLFMIVFAWGWWLFHHMRTMPTQALEIQVEAKKWSWDFIYKNGRRASSEFFVPVHQPVKLIMSSQDVIHSFFVPAFRVKQDVVPGRYTALWFEANQEGDFKVFCTEFCGDGHSEMKSVVHVVSREKYQEWMQNDPYKGVGLADIGRKVFESRCTACHNATSEKKIGPGFAGLFGALRKFQDGSSVAADENYLRNSVLNPNLQVVEGFPAVMPTFAGQVSEQEVLGVIEYLKSLK